MQDITEYSDQELSLQVFNTEDLYNQRHSKDFMLLIDERFKYTPSQLQVLIEDLEDDKLEMSNEEG